MEWWITWAAHGSETSITDKEEVGFLGSLGVSREKTAKGIKRLCFLFANLFFLPPASCEAEGSKHSRLVMTMILRSPTTTQEAGRVPTLD